MKLCNRCDGKGRLENESIRLSRFSRRIISWVPCFYCSGRGHIISTKRSKVKS